MKDIGGKLPKITEILFGQRKGELESCLAGFW